MQVEIQIAGAVRTPIGSFLGAFAELGAPALGARALRAALERAGVDAAAVDEVIFGNVIGAGLGQNVARQVSIGAGLPVSIGATTVNRVCGSGLKAVMSAAQAIQAGDARLVAAGGTENMSRAPYLLERARGGYRLGHGELVDAMVRDGLWDVYRGVHMGTCGDRTAAHCGIGRREQDDYALRSHRLARDAMAKGHAAREIAAVEVPRKKDAVLVSEDEGPKKLDEAKLRSLSPAFGDGGTVTAGNASSINDGAAAVLVASAARFAELGVLPIARILGYETFSREPEWFTLAPVGAIERLLGRIGIAKEQVDLFEINEAFAVVVLACARELGLPLEKVNVLGGAIALGHPIGASGARTLVTLLNALELRRARLGVVCLCVGGGEAVAMAVERI